MRPYVQWIAQLPALLWLLYAQSLNHTGKVLSNPLVALGCLTCQVLQLDKCQAGSCCAVTVGHMTFQLSGAGQRCMV